MEKSSWVGKASHLASNEAKANNRRLEDDILSIYIMSIVLSLKSYPSILFFILPSALVFVAFFFHDVSYEAYLYHGSGSYCVQKEEGKGVIGVVQDPLIRLQGISYNGKQRVHIHNRRKRVGIGIRKAGVPVMVRFIQCFVIESFPFFYFLYFF